MTEYLFGITLITILIFILAILILKTNLFYRSIGFIIIASILGILPIYAAKMLGNPRSTYLNIVSLKTNFKKLEVVGSVLGRNDEIYLYVLEENTMIPLSLVIYDLPPKKKREFSEKALEAKESSSKLFIKLEDMNLVKFVDDLIKGKKKRNAYLKYDYEFFIENPDHFPTGNRPKTEEENRIQERPPIIINEIPEDPRESQRLAY